MAKLINKYNLDWQLIRLQARDIKDVREKIEYVLLFIDNSPNIFNYARVLNWLKMTAISYKEDTIRALFAKAINYLLDNKSNYMGKTDYDIPLNKISDELLLKLYKDLKKRKYNFQYAKVPISHTLFMEKLKEEIIDRTLMLP